MKNLIQLITFVILFSIQAQAKLVKYELTVENKPTNLSGKATVDFALMVNGSIPAPTLEFTEGDEAEITVHNKIPNEELSIHWHGILLPPEEDGVPYVNTPPIYSGKSHKFKFKIRQHGTYWYHSHTRLQEQRGVYGAIVIHPAKKVIASNKELVVVLSDWSDENGDHIMENLRKDGDYYLYKKNSMRSWYGAMQAKSLGTMLMNEWTRMGGMDLSDVGYDAFLMNGKQDSQLMVAHPGDKIRIRIINAAASTYFYVSLGEEPMQIISADGVDVKPTWAKEILMGMAETYDILFEVPEHKNFQLKATAQDVTGFASGWIGMGNKVHAPEKPMPNMYASMDHSAHAGMDHSQHSGAADHSQHAGAADHSAHKDMDHSKHADMDHSAHAGHKLTPARPTAKHKTDVDMLTVDNLQSPTPTAFNGKKVTLDLKLVLGGDMERYVWHINGKAINEERTIFVNEGDVVRFTFENETMMHHPMHLHGHFFRVINAAGEYSPLKHTVDVSPHSSRTIEFLANEPGEWMLHCHNLYHMKTGMARVIKYMSYTPKPEILHYQKHDPHMHEHIYHTGRVEFATNHAQAEIKFLRTKDQIEAHYETREYKSDESEGELLYRRWFSNYLNLYGGAAYFAEYEEDEWRGIVGVSYLLPMLIETSVGIDHEGELHAEVEKRFQWTKTIFSEVAFNFREHFKTEFEITLMYANQWHWSAGLMFTEEDAGIGFEYKF